MKVLIATPAYGGIINTDYMEAVLKTIQFFRDEFPGIRFETRFLATSMLALSRNIFASMVLNEPSFTHLLFIDSDMGFNPELIAKMIAFNKPVVGVIAPKRQWDIEELQKAVLRAGSVQKDGVKLRISGAAYVGSESDLALRREADGSLSCDIKDGFVKVGRVGTGILLIQRQALDRLKERFPDEWLADPDATIRKMGLPHGGLLQCFDPIKAAHGVYNGEDMSFCQRWVEVCGGEIWANVDEPIIHVGQQKFIGRYIDRLTVMGGEIRPTSSLPGPSEIRRNRDERRIRRRAG